MTPLDTQNLIINGITTLGNSILVILSSIIIIAVGYLVFKHGKRLLFDRSLMVGGYYLRNTPYKGYNRFRSRNWNNKHTL